MKAETECFGSDPRTEAADHTRLFESPHAIRHRVRAQRHNAPQFHVPCSPVTLKRSENFSVNGVDYFVFIVQNSVSLRLSVSFAVRSVVS